LEINSKGRSAEKREKKQIKNREKGLRNVLPNVKTRIDFAFDKGRKGVQQKTERN